MLSFTQSDPGTKLDYCTILYAGSITAALNLENSSFPITSTVVKYSKNSGISLENSSPTIRHCVINENLGNGIHIVSGHPDLGTVNDPGGNDFIDNFGWEVYNNTPDTIYAQQNYWEEEDSAEIDNNHIFDDDENSSKGMVIFTPFISPPTDIEDETAAQIPTQYFLYQNYPNPFNPTTTIKYSISQRGLVIIKIYNAIGEEVATLINKEQPVGNYEVEFDATTLPSGIYFYRLKAGSFVETKKMVLMK